MNVEIAAIRPHDILELRQPFALEGFDDAPAWVREALTAAPFVIARRAPLVLTKLAVGVRGSERHQRWACTVDATRHVSRVICPPALLSRAISTHTETQPAALRQLRALTSTWRDLGRAWGPTGSAGFELATRVACVTPSSDLDLIIYADAANPMTKDEARRLYESLASSLTRVDVLIETPDYAFSLQEYATTPVSAPILLRTIDGPRLGSIDDARSTSVAFMSPERGTSDTRDGMTVIAIA